MEKSITVTVKTATKKKLPDGGVIFFKENFTIHGDWCGRQNSKVRLSIYLRNQYFLLQNPKNQKKSVERRSIESFNLKWRMDYLLIQELMCMPIIY